MAKVKTEKTVMIAPVVKISTRDAIKEIALSENRSFAKQVQVALDYFIEEHKKNGGKK